MAKQSGAHSSMVRYEDDATVLDWCDQNRVDFCMGYSIYLLHLLGFAL